MIAAGELEVGVGGDALLHLVGAIVDQAGWRAPCPECVAGRRPRSQFGRIGVPQPGPEPKPVAAGRVVGDRTGIVLVGVRCPCHGQPDPAVELGVPYVALASVAERRLAERRRWREVGDSPLVSLEPLEVGPQRWLVRLLRDESHPLAPTIAEHVGRELARLAGTRPPLPPDLAALWRLYEEADRAGKFRPKHRDAARTLAVSVSTINRLRTRLEDLGYPV